MLLPSRWRHKRTVRAVHDDDLEPVLHQLGVMDKLLQGELTCAACGSVLRLSNIGCIFARDGQIALACDAEDCCARALAGGGDLSCGRP